MVEAYRPDNIKEALEIMANKPCTVLAGGTDLMVRKKLWSGTENNFNNPVLFISGIEDMKRIEKKDGFLIIGAGCTCSDIIKSYVVPDILKDVMRSMASPAIRNAATIGGNIVNSSPAGDSLPYLYAAGARVVLESIRGRREVEIKDFITGPGKNIIERDELLIEIKIPLKDFNVKTYRKVGTRKSIALSKLSFVGLAGFDGGSIKDIRVAFGAVGPTVVRSRELEERILSGVREKGTVNISDVLNMYEKVIKPIDDQRSTAGYRKEVSLRLLREFLKSLL